MKNFLIALVLVLTVRNNDNEECNEKREKKFCVQLAEMWQEAGEILKKIK